MKENHKRSILKALSWRALGSIFTVIVVFAFTGKGALAFSVGGIELFAKFALYYFHERIWANVKWGTSPEA